jgi:hypothetical protein
MFDWMVVDTPPIAILPDANLLAAMIITAYDYGYPGYAPARPHDRSGRWRRWLRKSNRMAVPRPSAASSAAEQSLG